MRLSELLGYYQKPGVAEELVRFSENREVSVMFGLDKFGKRPDILQYPSDVIEAIRRGATSFHCSEEKWQNPLSLKQESTKKDLDDLRVGWDLIIDIDCKTFEFSKICANIILDSLKEHNVNCASIKFSGGTGFHIGIPGIALSDEKLTFPETPQMIVQFIKEYIKERLKQEIEVKVGNIQKLIEISKKSKEDILKNPLHEKKPEAPPFYEDLGKGVLISREDMREKEQQKIEKEFYQRLEFDPFTTLGIDIGAIAPRHMMRAPYSLNEKKGLISLPIKPEQLEHFRPDWATPDNFEFTGVKFLDYAGIIPGEASQLLLEALDWWYKEQTKKTETEKTGAVFEFTEKVPKEKFPPCMQLVLAGLQDGRKRGLFALLNFMKLVKWSWPEIEAEIKEWNNRNPIPLKQGYLQSQLNWHKRNSAKIPPPNCRDFYKDFAVCKPDNRCEKIKNPISYPRNVFSRPMPQPGKARTNEVKN